MIMTFSNAYFCLSLFLIILCMAMHNLILKGFTRYEAKNFRDKYFQSYKHIFVPASHDLNQPDNYQPISTTLQIDSHVIGQPSWALRLHKKEFKPVFMSIFVLSAPANFKKRKKMRKDFSRFMRNHVSDLHVANKRLATLTFLIGHSGIYSVEFRVNEEYKKYGDILKLEINKIEMTVLKV